MKRGFTLVEMLVVIGIIVVLVGSGLGAYSRVQKAADKKRCQELVSNTATALSALFQKEGSWPRSLRQRGAKDGELDEVAAYALARGGYMSLTTSNGRLGGNDRFGIVSPWAAAYIKRHGTSASRDAKVGLGSIKDHTLHFALDLDGDGIIEGASVGGETVDIRATAAVWCCGKDGIIEPYSQGLQKDDVYSWAVGQTRSVK